MHWLRKYRRGLLACAILTVLISFLWSPQAIRNNDKGYVSLHWSGFRALFDKEDHFGVRTSYYEETSFNGTDGPYVFLERKQYRYYSVDENNQLRQEAMHPGDSLCVLVPNGTQDSFFIRPKPAGRIEKARYNMPSRILVISDIEGNFNGFHSFLLNNQVIDSQYNWTFGDGHLVLLGDFVDRGHEVTQVLWLIYRLESLARSSGGKVHYILGNHELMNLQGRPGYADKKYVKAAQEISGRKEWDKAYRYLYSEYSVLGAWLRKKNSIEKIGNYLFVHGGLSPKLLDYTPSIETINNRIRQSLDSAKTSDAFTSLLIGPEGPLWFRRMATDYKKEKKLTVTEFDTIMKHFSVEKIVIGHTLAEDISIDYDGRLIRADVQHGKEKNSGLTRGVLIEDGIAFKVNDRGVKTKLN